MKKYKHLFFDLDHTLWDFNKNTSVTLKEILSEFRLEDIIKKSDDFILLYHKHNDFVWDLFREGKIKKDKLRVERFRLLLNDFKITDPKMILKISDFYLANSPDKPGLIEGALEVLSSLHDYYKLYIISNGFYDTQVKKLKASKIEFYFTKVFTSEHIGFSKPHRSFFDYAIKSANAKKSESLVIGDSLENDITGAKNTKIDQVWFNPLKATSTFEPTYIIGDLTDLLQFL